VTLDRRQRRRQPGDAFLRNCRFQPKRWRATDYRATITGRMTRTSMTRILVISGIGWMLAALMPTDAGSARAASRGVSTPPPPLPRVVVRLPAVRIKQQQSFWGVNTNLQRSRDDWQFLPPQDPRNSPRPPKAKSAGRIHWSGVDQ